VSETYDTCKDQPEFAVKGLSLLLESAIFGSDVSDTDLPERRRKALYLLKTLSLAAGITEGRFAQLIVKTNS
jgi:hypothetical protein